MPCTTESNTSMWRRRCSSPPHGALLSLLLLLLAGVDATNAEKDLAGGMRRTEIISYQDLCQLDASRNAGLQWDERSEHCVDAVRPCSCCVVVFQINQTRLR